MTREPKRAQRVAERIEHEILDRGLPPGHRLGAEPELIERFGVSRAVLREAIRLVERHGLASSRRGAGGGLFVVQPAREAIAGVLCAYLEQIGLELRELFEARSVVEGALVHHAAIRASREEAQELQAILREQRAPISTEEDAAFFARFDKRLGEIARSPILALYARALRRAGAHIGQGLQFSKADVHEIFRLFHRSYLGIARAIEEHDVESARRRLLGFQRRNEKEWQGRRRRRRPDRGAKQGDLLASEIAESIREAGLAPGARLGAEQELLEAHGVSRSSLREAIRLLEQHGIAEMRRGGSSGLFVCEPDPAAVIRSASVYLNHLGLSIGPVRDALMTIEPRTAALSAERSSSEGLAELVDRLDAALTARGGRELRVAADQIHAQIAQLGGNRALGLFSGVNIHAIWNPDTRVRKGELPEDSSEAVRAAFERLVESIVERDSRRAERLTTYFMELTLEWWPGRQRILQRSR